MCLIIRRPTRRSTKSQSPTPSVSERVQRPIEVNVTQVPFHCHPWQGGAPHHDSQPRRNSAVRGQDDVLAALQQDVKMQQQAQYGLDVKMQQTADRLDKHIDDDAGNAQRWQDQLQGVRHDVASGQRKTSELKKQLEEKGGKVDDNRRWFEELLQKKDDDARAERQREQQARQQGREEAVRKAEKEKKRLEEMRAHEEKLHREWMEDVNKATDERKREEARHMDDLRREFAAALAQHAADAAANDAANAAANARPARSRSQNSCRCRQHVRGEAPWFAAHPRPHFAGRGAVPDEDVRGAARRGRGRPVSMDGAVRFAGTVFHTVPPVKRDGHHRRDNRDGNGPRHP